MKHLIEKHFLSNFFAQNKAIALLFLMSVLLFSAYGFGWLKTDYDLIGDRHKSDIEKSIIGNASGELQIGQDGSVLSTCSMPGSKDIDFCGLVIGIGESIKIGQDFSRYNEVSLKASVNAPVSAPRLRLSFRNYNAKYSIEGDGASLKYNTLIVTPQNNQIDVIVPISYLHVETWWVKQYSVPIELSQQELSNVVSLDILHHDTLLKGKYAVGLLELKLHGQYLTLVEVLFINSVLWGLIIYLLIKRQSESLKQLASFDTLTKLANRRGLQEWVDKLKISSSSTKHLTLFYIDIDDFKNTNDTYGHKAGDALLQGFTQRVIEALNKSAKSINHIFSRMSGDEFVILFENMPDNESKAIAEQILLGLEPVLDIEDVQVKVNISMGIASEIAASNNLKSLFEMADSAMYHAKKSGKNQYKLIHEVAEDEDFHSKSVIKTISDAIANNQFDLKFMPIFDVKTKLVKNVEVLIRPDSPDLKHLDTSAIVKIAEEFNLIQTLDKWVMENTLSILDENRQSFEHLGLKFCINVSTMDIKDINFYDNVKNCLEKYNIPPEWIELEITETAFVNNDGPSIDSLNKLRKLNVSLALDDFGTGYTAFNQLIHYPVTKLKIDRSFVSGLDKHDKAKEVLVDAIFSIAKTYELELTAEGVENLEQYYYLVDKGCDYIQGYLFAQPLTLRELIKGLRNQNKFGFGEV